MDDLIRDRRVVLRLDDQWVWDSWVADDGELYHLFFLQAPRALGDPACGTSTPSAGTPRAGTSRRGSTTASACGRRTPGSTTSGSGRDPCCVVLTRGGTAGGCSTPRSPRPVTTSSTSGSGPPSPMTCTPGSGCATSPPSWSTAAGTRRC